jgi:hypothetical protein
MMNLLIIEDGTEYEAFARLFLADLCDMRAAHCAEEALALLTDFPADRLLVDLRFDRSDEGVLVGDVGATAERLFAGDVAQAVDYLKENQGTLILAALRGAGHDQPAVFVHDFRPARLANLSRLYGDVQAVRSFDAALIRGALGGDR